LQNLQFREGSRVTRSQKSCRCQPKQTTSNVSVHRMNVKWTCQACKTEGTELKMSKCGPIVWVMPAASGLVFYLCFMFVYVFVSRCIFLSFFF